MEGLAGQNRPQNNIKVRMVKNKRKVDLSKDNAYKIEPVNFDVPIRKDKVMNANLKAKIINKEDMMKLGFIEQPFQWVLEKKVSHINTMEEYLIVRITKDSCDLDISVVDKYTGMVYDYQAQLNDDELNRYANKIHGKVIEVMLELVEAGVISGYKRNDYI